jgi:hypothetical protein
MGAVAETTKVYPSDLALAAAAAPTLPPCPGLLSITKDWPKRLLNLSANTRPTLSVAVPGGKPTTKVTGLVGQAGLSCACAAVKQHDKTQITRNRKPGWLMGTPCNMVTHQDVADYSAHLKFDNHLGDSKSRVMAKKKCLGH